MGDRLAPASGACSRRDFFRSGINLAAAGSTGLWLAGCAMRGGAAGPAVSPADQTFERAARPALSGLAALAAIDEQNGGADPFPIPWLDKNGNHNQAPGPNQEPSSIFHFKGRVARSNGFTGVGTDNDGRRIPFGINTTDYSFMQGVYWAGRQERRGAFTHT
jgi:hypothetical protein